MDTRTSMLIVAIIGSIGFFAYFGNAPSIESQKTNRKIAVTQTKVLGIQNIADETLIGEWNNVDYICRFNRPGSEDLILGLGTDDNKNPEKLALIRVFDSERVFTIHKESGDKPYPDVVEYRSEGFALVLKFDPVKDCPECEGAAKTGQLTLSGNNQKLRQRFEGFCAM